jgi:hypothetical protein
MKNWILTIVGATAVLVASSHVGTLHATPAAGFVGVTIVKGTFGDINAFNSIVPPDFWKNWLKSDVWFSLQKTKGNSDLYIQSNTWQPGGTTGWHSHPGHSLIIITSGTVTNYESDSPLCKPAVYTGTPANPATFVDEGGDHVHMVRNEGTQVATGYAVQLIPAGANRRIDADAPAHCPQ